MSSYQIVELKSRSFGILVGGNLIEERFTCSQSAQDYIDDHTIARYVVTKVQA